VDSPNRVVVRSAMDALKPYLATYVTQALAKVPVNRRADVNDIHGLLGAMLAHWDAVFSSQLPTTVRHYVFELRDVRNRWAHEKDFTADEARRAVDTAHLVAAAIGAPRDVVTRFTAMTSVSARAKSGAISPASSKASTGRSILAPVRQVDKMRELYDRFAPDDERIVREYAAAEKRGEVVRKRNTYGLSPDDYARRLLADGIRKGWLSRSGR
jgi:HEPN superfamily Swt1-like protein